jgi:hypothetical protein
MNKDAKAWMKTNVSDRVMALKTAYKSITLRFIKQLVLLLLILAGIVMLSYFELPRNVNDWDKWFRPATLLFLQGRNPYDLAEFHNAPWTLFILIPFALLPRALGQIAWFLAGLLVFTYIAYKLNARWFSTVLFLTSYPVFVSLMVGGLDWLPMLAFVTPPPISLMFAAMKPQVGIGIALYWLWVAWKSNGWKEVLRWSLPTLLLLFASFIFYGFWPLTFLGKESNPVNISLFPYLLPVAIYLQSKGVKKAAIASGPLFSPYLNVLSLATPLAAVLDRPKVLLFLWILLWLYAFARVLIFM